MYTITITGTTRERVVDSGDEYIAVSAEIQKDGETVAKRRFGFLFDSTEDHIRTTLSRVLEAYIRDQELAKDTERSEKLNANADALEAKLAGMVVEHESNQ
jgi:hypothetical protein